MIADARVCGPASEASPPHFPAAAQGRRTALKQVKQVRPRKKKGAGAKGKSLSRRPWGRNPSAKRAHHDDSMRARKTQCKRLSPPLESVWRTATRACAHRATRLQAHDASRQVRAGRGRAGQGGKHRRRCAVAARRLVNLLPLASLRRRWPGSSSSSCCSLRAAVRLALVWPLMHQRLHGHLRTYGQGSPVRVCRHAARGAVAAALSKCRPAEPTAALLR